MAEYAVAEVVMAAATFFMIVEDEEVGWLVGSGLTALSAQIGHIVP